ncbi:MAG: hypothetical protein GKR90_10615 [Pseudomonadales bacterium]|nr:hypothetical protein [Pseudomonadales bacterium]
MKVLHQFTTGSVALCLALLASVVCANDEATPHEFYDVQPMQVFGGGGEVNGSAVLTRDYRNKLLTADLALAPNVLMPGDAYSIWWVVFNKPKNCTTAFSCSASDLGNKAVKGTAFWAGGFVADGFGGANLTISVGKGKNDREVFAGGDYGLRALSRAEVHLVIRTHGPAGVAGSLARQIGTANESCPVSGCQNQFASLHPSPVAP